jgi:hypothetical protein
MRSLYFFFIIVLLAAFSSCRKVITLKLRDSEEKFVIEGVVTNEPGVCKVLISKTRHFNEDNQFEGISGAIVKVKDNGTEFTLSETRPGHYESTQVTGVPGHVYQLTVTVSGQTFTAYSTMPQPVKLDTLYVAPGPFGQFDFPTIAYTDPAGINNGYRFVQYVNGIKEPRIFWDDDEFTDGQPVVMQLDNGADEKDDPGIIRPGDEVTIEMLTLDEPIFRFWYSMRSGGGAGNSNAAAPGNPITNLQGAALGYFSAHTVDRRTVIAP